MEELQKENEELKKKNAELEERLKKYTCGKNHKTYYEKNKQKVMENGANYLQKLKEENNCDEDIIYRSDDDPDIFMSKFSDKKDDNSKKPKIKSKTK